MKSLKLLMFAGLASIAFCVASAQNTTSGSKANSAGALIDLVADSGFYDQQAGRAVYEGNVRATQGLATIWADKVTITLKNNAADSIEATSKSSKKLVRFEYKGKKQPIKGQGRKALYQVSSKTVTLSGNAKIEQGKDVIKGNKLSYNLTKEVIKGSRVRMSFLPNSKK